MIAITVIMILVTFLTGFILGKHQERIEWNKLIKEGRLPKPKKQK